MIVDKLIEFREMVKPYQEKVENDIKKIVDAFEEDTGLTIYGIFLNRTDITSIGDEGKKNLVKIEINTGF